MSNLCQDLLLLAGTWNELLPKIQGKLKALNSFNEDSIQND